MSSSFPAEAAPMLTQYIGEADREVFVVALLTIRHPAAMSRSGEGPAPFERSIPANGNGGDPATIEFTIVRGPVTHSSVRGHTAAPVA